MCVLNKKSRRKSFTGYKVLAMRDDKYYSTFTGQEISVGKVPEPPVRASRIGRHWNSDLDWCALDSLGFYRSDYAGKTAVFILKEHCHNLFDDISREYGESSYKIVCVKMKIAGELWSGSYNYQPIMAGTEILSIKLIEIYEEAD